MSDVLPELSEALKTAHAAALEGQKALLNFFRNFSLKPQEKRDGSPVTAADRAAERVIREVLEAAFPAIDILGEEEGFEDRGSRLRWIIDPIDGTISFIRGIPLFGTLIGLQDRQTDTILAGVLHLPALDRTYLGARGLGARCGDRVLRLPPGPAGPLPWDASVPGSDPFVVSAGDPSWFRAAGRATTYEQLGRLPLLRGYSDCFGHSLVLEGSVHAMVDPGLELWDLAASTVLIEEAGGVVLRRESALEGKTDAILGQRGTVETLATDLGW